MNTRCNICNMVHADGLTCEIETLQNCLQATQAERDAADKVIANLKAELQECSRAREQNAHMYLFMLAVAKEFRCLPSFADPRPEHGNAHIMHHIREAKVQKTKCCCEELHAEFGHVYAALTCFLKDWKDGDFTLPRLAEIHAEKLRDLICSKN